MNPCPCGYFGSDRCRCTERDVKKYQAKLSGPILDRIDLLYSLLSRVYSLLRRAAAGGFQGDD